MRILVLSNLYPPYSLGGYEIACAEVVEALRQRGHDVTVLTSSRGLCRPQAQSSVRRLLKMRFAFDPPYRNAALQFVWLVWNLLVVRITVRRLKPDLVYVFNPACIGAFVLNWLHEQSVPVVHDIFDTWLTDTAATSISPGLSLYEPRALLGRIAKAALLKAGSVVLAPKPINLGCSYFRSEYLKRQFADAGLDVQDVPVIYFGLRRSHVRSWAQSDVSAGIVFSGRLSPEKGAHVLLAALPRLTDSVGRQYGRLTIIGPVTDQGYWQQLQELAAEGGAYPSIHFTGQLPRTDAVALMREHSVFVFPVLWEEPFGIVLIEALDAGLAVIATRSGGAAEILVDGENSIIVGKNDPQAVADALERLAKDDALRRRIVDGGHETAKRFDFERGIDKLEEYLQSVCN